MVIRNDKGALMGAYASKISDTGNPFMVEADVLLLLYLLWNLHNKWDLITLNWREMRLEL